MKDNNVAKAYAKAIIELGQTDNINIADELTKLTELINTNNDLENVLFLDVFTVEEKEAVMKDILTKLSISPIVKSFINFLINEKRISIFPLIFKEVIVIDDHKKGFMRGTIEGASDEIDDAMVVKIKEYLKGKLSLNPELTYVKNKDITAGVRITVEDYQLDASIDKQLKDFKDSVLNN